MLLSRRDRNARVRPVCNRYQRGQKIFHGPEGFLLHQHQNPEFRGDFRASTADRRGYGAFAPQNRNSLKDPGRLPVPDAHGKPQIFRLFVIFKKRTENVKP